MRESEFRYRITIRNWDHYQRELKGAGLRNRRRHWIALSVNLNRDPDFLRLTVEQRYLWIMMLCHAGAVGPEFVMSPSDARLLFKLSRNPKFQALSDQGFIDLECLTEAEQEAEEAAKTEAKKQITAKDEQYTKRLDELKAIYPKRIGSQPWPRAMKAANARLKDGATWKQMMAGVRRYAAFCKATRKTGTEYVMMASTFFGPDDHFKNPWEAPMGDDQKNAAWEMALEYSSGGYRHGKLNDALVRAALQRIGGRESIGQCREDRLEWKRKEFLAAYSAVVSEAR